MTKIAWVFDVISPFSYLSLKQLPRLPQDTEIEFVPVLFAGLLNHYGQIGNAEIAGQAALHVPLRALARKKVRRRDASASGAPIHPLAALRLIIVAGSDRRAVETVFDAVFMRGRDVADGAVIADLARELGIADPQSALSHPRSNSGCAITRTGRSRRACSACRPL